MEDQIQDSEELEVATQETDIDESQQHSEEETPPVEADKKAEEQDRNWRAIRQRQKEMEYELRQRDEMLAFYKQQQKPAEKVQEEPDVNDEEFVPAGGVKGIARKAIQPLEKKIQDLEARLAQQDQSRLMNSLRTQFTDFDDVVNVETLEILEKQEPELAATIAEFKDPYKMGMQSYKYIKALGLADSLPSARRKKEITSKIEKNAKTVQSPMAYDKRPMAQAFKSTAADQKRLYAEMMGYASKATGL